MTSSGESLPEGINSPTFWTYRTDGKVGPREQRKCQGKVNASGGQLGPCVLTQEGRRYGWTQTASVTRGQDLRVSWALASSSLKSHRSEFLPTTSFQSRDPGTTDFSTSTV